MSNAAEEPKRNARPRGEHSLVWFEERKRWRARAVLGYDARGKRIDLVRWGKSQSAALAELRKALREREQGITRKVERYTVGEAVADFLALGLPNRDENTIKSYTSVANNHIIPHLGEAKIKDLGVRDIENWLQGLSSAVGRATLSKARMVLSRAIRRAIAHELAIRNVAEHVELPSGKAGRPSKSFTAAQADAILRSTKNHRMHAYVVVSMFTGARTEEMRELTWDHVVLEERGGVPPHMMVWRSVRRTGDTKTKKSRRTIALPQRCVDVLKGQHERQARERRKAGAAWHKGPGYVFTTQLGGQLDVNNVRRDFRTALRKVKGIEADDWTPRELRHSFVSLLSDAGVPLEEISRLVGHSGTTVTELVYRHQIRPVVETGAVVMDQLFAPNSGAPAGAHGSTSGSTPEDDATEPP